jgi:valyl-tRNA synthetase
VCQRGCLRAPAERRALTHVARIVGTVEFGVITSFAYQLEDKSGEIVVATTR